MYVAEANVYACHIFRIDDTKNEQYKKFVLLLINVTPFYCSAFQILMDICMDK